MKANVRVEKVTPEMADEMLCNLFEGQRSLREGYVGRILSDMASGRFHLSPDAIVLVKGKLANGQHRLEAVRRFGKPVSFIILESDDDDLYQVIDCGLRRTVGDALIGVKYGRQIPSIAKWVLSYDNETLQPSAKCGTSAPSHSRLVEFCRENEAELSDAAEISNPLYEKTRLLAASIAGALQYLGARAGHREKTAQFLGLVFEGGGKGCANDLRNRLIANKGTKARLPQGYIFGLALKALKMWLSGTELGVLKWAKNEPLPTLE